MMSPLVLITVISTIIPGTAFRIFSTTEFVCAIASLLPRVPTLIFIELLSVVKPEQLSRRRHNILRLKLGALFFHCGHRRVGFC
jgi:hypothetical protein